MRITTWPKIGEHSLRREKYMSEWKRGGTEGAKILSILTNNDTSFEYFLSRPQRRVKIEHCPTSRFHTFQPLCARVRRARIVSRIDHLPAIISRGSTILFLAYVVSSLQLNDQRQEYEYKDEFYNSYFFGRIIACRVEEPKKVVLVTLPLRAIECSVSVDIRE